MVVVKLADGKERTLQHISATSFWDTSGKPVSAAEFVEQLFGELPAFFKDEDELRKLWGQPETRRALLNALKEKGFGGEQLNAIGKMIDAENSDLFDVLAYIAFKFTPISRKERVEKNKAKILSSYDDKLQAFLDFVLAQYIQEGVGELDREKLPQLLELKYQGVNDAAKELGGVSRINDAFIGFQKWLY
jgi:type I restriction enzyme R subunit